MGPVIWWPLASMVVSLPDVFCWPTYSLLGETGHNATQRSKTRSRWLSSVGCESRITHYL